MITKQQAVEAGEAFARRALSGEFGSVEGLNSWPTSRAFMEVMGMLKFFAGVDAASTLGVTLEDQSLMIPYLKGFNSGLGKGMGLDG